MTEHQNLEWKESWRDEYLRWICGFANAQGGKLVIGKNDRGEVVGVKDAQRLLEELPNKVRDILGILVDVDLKKTGGKEFIEITVDPYPYPISYKGQYHYRSGSTKQELKGAALDRFLLKKQGKHWDGVPLPGLNVRKLAGPALKRFRERAKESGRMDPAVLRESAARLVENLHLVEGRYLKRAAALLFHSDPERFVTGAHVKVGFFRTDSDLLYHDEISGDLFIQVDKTMELLLTKYLRAGIRYEGVQRIESFPVPEAALREVLLNAVVHKDYSSGSPIQISVYDDKLMVWNAGELPADWTLKKLTGKHPSEPFNPDIANAFFRAGMIEAWGRGIQKIQDECRLAGVSPPVFRVDDGLWVEFAFPSLRGTTQGEPGVQAPVQTRVETPVQRKAKTPEQVLKALRANPKATLADVAALIGKSVSTVERAAAKLVQSGHLRFVGPKKAGHWEVLK